MNNNDFVNSLEKVSPFHRIAYIAMLLYLHPNNYKLDPEDEKIIYGPEKKQDLIDKLVYIQYRRMMAKQGLKDFSKLDELFFKKNYQELRKEINKYKIDESQIENGLWTYFRSHVLDKNDKIDFHSKDVKHRLYLTIKFEYRADFAKAFIDSCVKNNIPYYFKVCTIKGQTDTIVIYINNEENLKKTIIVINEIYAKKDFKKFTKEPAPHLYKINDYIGYGFEPPLINNERTSYTEFMEKIAAGTSEKRKKLRKKIIDDFKSGRIYNIKNKRILIPTKDVMNKFINSKIGEKYNIFNKYFYYFLEVYGKEIMEILNEIKANKNKLLNTTNINSRKVR